jgi:hypothetical protein
MPSSFLIELMVIIVTAAILIKDDVFKTIIKLLNDIYTFNFRTEIKKTLSKVTKLNYTKPKIKILKLKKLKLIIVQTQIVLRMLTIKMGVGKDESLQLLDIHR